MTTICNTPQRNGAELVVTSMCGSHCLVWKAEAGSVNEMFVFCREIKMQQKNKNPMTPLKRQCFGGFFSSPSLDEAENSVHTDHPVIMISEILVGSNLMR